MSNIVKSISYPSQTGLRLSQTLPSVLRDLPAAACRGIFPGLDCADMDSRRPIHPTNYINGTFGGSRPSHNRPEFQVRHIAAVQYNL